MGGILRRSLVVVATFAAFGILLPEARAQSPFSGMISFGDSLTDVGNVATITNPGYAPLINGYYNESQFSDGPIWNQMVASYWGLPAPTVGRVAIDGQSAQLPGNDWAWGSSASGTGYVTPSYVTGSIPNLLTEVTDYISQGTETPTPSTLYSIWSGADNLIVNGQFSPAAAIAAANSVQTSIVDLNQDGGQNFLIFNMPDLGDTPDAESSGQAYVDAAHSYSVDFNLQLASDISALESGSYGFTGTVYFVDVYDVLKDIVETVDAGGTYTPDFYTPGGTVSISNVTGTALGVYQNTGTDPSNYLFWDGVHPTTEGDQIVAGLVLQAIPEPAPALLAFSGIIFACWHASRRRDPKEAQCGVRQVH